MERMICFAFSNGEMFGSATKVYCLSMKLLKEFIFCWKWVFSLLMIFTSCSSAFDCLDLLVLMLHRLDLLFLLLIDSSSAALAAASAPASAAAVDSISSSTCASAADSSSSLSSRRLSRH